MTSWPRWRVQRTSEGVSRRAFLGGAAALVTLPPLLSLLPRGARADGTPPRRFVAVYLPCGIHMPSWTPTTEGRDWAITPILEPVAHLRDRLLVVSGLENGPAIATGGGDHARGTAAFLTCTTPRFDKVGVGTSADQLASAVLGRGMAFPSLQLTAGLAEASGRCDGSYPCAYTSAVSWADDATPLPGLSSPTALFDMLFRGYDPRLSEADQIRRRAYRKSVLDGVIDEIDDLQPRLATDDRRRLDAYLTGVRELERSLAQTQTSCAVPGRPAPTTDPSARIDGLSALVALAFTCDLTRVVTFMFDAGGSNRPYPFLGLPGSHHEYSHHMGLEENFRALEAIDRWEIERLAVLLDALDAVGEGDGSVLDHTALVCSSEVSDGNAHTHVDMPVLVAGSAGGALVTGVHLRADGAPMAALLASMLEAVGAPQASFGDADGPLEDVLVSR